MSDEDLGALQNWSEIELLIDELDTNPAEKTKLWLLAWSEQPREIRELVLDAVPSAS